MIRKLTLAVSIALILNGICHAASTPVNLNDFKDTSWVLYGTTTVSAGKAGSGKATGVCYADFEADGSVHFEDEENYVMSGTYYLDPTGKLVVNVTEQDVQDFFDEYVPEMLDFYSISGLNWSIDVTSVKNATKVKYSGDAISFATSISAKADLYIDYYGESYHFKISFTTKVAGDHPAASAASWASKWLVNGKANLSGRKVKVNGPVTLDVTIGNYGVTGLGINQFKMIDTNAVIFNSTAQGDFCRTGSKVMFLDSNIDIDTVIQNLYMDNAPDNVVSVDVVLTQGAMTATVKNGKSISLTGTTKFELDIYFNDQAPVYGSKGTLKIAGKGIPVP
jgi:hypothetical protein